FLTTSVVEQFAWRLQLLPACASNCPAGARTGRARCGPLREVHWCVFCGPRPGGSRPCGVAWREGWSRRFGRREVVPIITDRRRREMKLYMHPVSTVCRPIRLLCAENGIKIDEETVDLMTGAHHKEAYASLNPNRQVPLLVDGDLKLTEGVAILKYIREKYKLPS